MTRTVRSTSLGEDDLNEAYVDPILSQLTPADIALAWAATNYPAGRNEVIVELEDDEP